MDREEYFKKGGLGDTRTEFTGVTIVDIGDMIKWGGIYVGGEYLSGENTVADIYEDNGILWMDLDNGKKFILENLTNPTSKIPGGWKVIRKLK